MSELKLYAVIKCRKSDDTLLVFESSVNKEDADKCLAACLTNQAGGEKTWLVQYSLPGIKEIELSKVEEEVSGEDVESAVAKPKGLDLYFVVIVDSGDNTVFKHFFDEDEGLAYFDKVNASNSERSVSFITHKIPGVCSVDDLKELETRIGQLKLFKDVCSESAFIKDERIKQLEVENKALRTVVRLCVGCD